MNSGPDAITPAIALEDVDVPHPSQGGPPLFRQVRWTIRSGECWLLTGAPGCGKSTVLQVASALLRPSRGTLRLFGDDIAALEESAQLAHRSRLGLVFGHGGRLFSHLTVAENIALPLRYHAPAHIPDPGTHLQRLLEALSLESYAHRVPGELPRLVAPRVALARALALAPDVLMVDDPTSGLIPREAEWWSNMLANALGSGIPGLPIPRTLVIAAQDPHPWIPLAPRLASLDASTHMFRVLDSGAPDAGALLRPDAAA